MRAPTGRPRSILRSRMATPSPEPTFTARVLDRDGLVVVMLRGEADVTVAEAMEKTGADVSVVFVPPAFAKAAVVEAIDAGIGLAVVITEGIPVQDSAWFWTYSRGKGTRIIGPNCPGIISPGKCNIGITAGEIAQTPSPDGPNVGIVSRSGTLTYQALYELKQKGIGVSTCVGIGGDPVPGTNFIDCLAEFQADPETHAIMMIGEIGGSAEEEAAEYIKANVTKPMSA